MQVNRTITNLLAPYLLKWRWKRANFDFFENKNLQKYLFNNIPIFKSDKKARIIIGSIRSLNHSLLFEGALGMAFKKAGNEVKLLQCGQFLKSCETKTHFKKNNIFCSLCNHEFSLYKEAFGLEGLLYKDLISINLDNEIKSFIEDIELNSFDKWKGYSLKKEWECGLQRYYLSTQINLDTNPDVAKSFLYTVIASFEIGKKLVEIGYTHLISSHGIYTTWGGLAAGFKAAKGDVTIWGRGYYKSGIVSYKEESYLNGLKKMSRNDFVENINFDYKEEIESYLNSKWELSNSEDLVSYYNRSNSLEKVNLKLDPNKQYIGFYPNIPWDGQAFVSTQYYRSLRDVIESLIKYANHNKNVQIIIRPHPAENPSKNPNIGERFMDIAEEYELKLNKNFILLPYESSLTSYDVAEMVDINVLFAGSIGLELAVRGHKVIQLGENVSSNKEFFFEPKNYLDFEITLDKELKENIDLEIKRQKALDWATFYYGQVHMEDPFFVYRGYHMVEPRQEIDKKRLFKYMNWIISGEKLYNEE